MKTSPFCGLDSCRVAASFAPSLISMEVVDLKLAASVATEISYFDGEMLGKTNSPAGVVLAVHAGLPEASVSVTVAPETGLPAASRSTPLQEAGRGAATVHSDRNRKMRATAPSRRIEERTTEELYQWIRTFLRSLRAVKGPISVIVDLNQITLRTRIVSVNGIFRQSEGPYFRRVSLGPSHTAGRR